MGGGSGVIGDRPFEWLLTRSFFDVLALSAVELDSLARTNLGEEKKSLGTESIRRLLVRFRGILGEETEKNLSKVRSAKIFTRSYMEVYEIKIIKQRNTIKKVVKLLENILDPKKKVENESLKNLQRLCQSLYWGIYKSGYYRW